jgi:hypothetical protein
VHTLAYFQALVFMVLGLLWPKLSLGRRAAGIAWWAYVYSSFATLAPYVMAAVWAAGGTVIPLAAGSVRGTQTQEALIRLVLASGVPPLFVSLVIIARGLRMPSTGTVAAGETKGRSTTR